MKNKAFFALVLCTIIDFCSSFKILVLLPHPGLSHHFVFEPLLKALSNRGHEMTIASHFPLNDPSGKYQFVNLTGSLPILKEVKSLDGVMQTFFVPYFHLLDGFFISENGFRCCKAFIDMPNVKALYNIEESFDVILTELFNSDCTLAFVDKFKAPHVTLTSHILMPWSTNRFGAIDNPSYVPYYYSRYGKKMSFFDRLENTIFSTYHKLVHALVSSRRTETFLQRNLWTDFDLSPVARNTSIVLVNTHHSLNGALPRSPNVVEVGGMHVGDPKPLKPVCSELVLLHKPAVLISLV